MTNIPEWVEAYALIRNPRGEYLIVRDETSDGEPWRFVGGKTTDHASPDSRIVEIAHEQIGARIEIQQAQPQFVYNFGTHTINYTASSLKVPIRVCCVSRARRLGICGHPSGLHVAERSPS